MGGENDLDLERALEKRAQELAQELRETLEERDRLRALRGSRQGRPAIPPQREPDEHEIRRKPHWRGLGVIGGLAAMIASLGRQVRSRIKPTAAIAAGAVLVTTGAALLLLPPDGGDSGQAGDPPSALGPFSLGTPEPTEEPTERPPTPVPQPTLTASRDGPSRLRDPGPPAEGPGLAAEPTDFHPPGTSSPTQFPTVPETAVPTTPVPSPTVPPTVTPTATDPPPPSPTPTATVTSTPPPSPTPTVTDSPTATPTQTPTATPTRTPRHCLIYIEVPELLRLCILGRL